MNTHDIELPQGYAERPFDYWGDLYTEGQVRAAIEADQPGAQQDAEKQAAIRERAGLSSQCSTFCAYDAEGRCAITENGECDADLISKYQEKVRALEAENHNLVAEVDDRKRRGEPVAWIGGFRLYWRPQNDTP